MLCLLGLLCFPGSLGVGLVLVSSCRCAPFYAEKRRSRRSARLVCNLSRLVCAFGDRSAWRLVWFRAFGLPIRGIRLVWFAGLAIWFAGLAIWFAGRFGGLAAGLTDGFVLIDWFERLVRCVWFVR